MKPGFLKEELDRMGVTLTAFAERGKFGIATLYKFNRDPKSVRGSTAGKICLELSRVRLGVADLLEGPYARAVGQS